jgi:hypothetical protein
LSSILDGGFDILIESEITPLDCLETNIIFLNDTRVKTIEVKKKNNLII